MTNHIVITQDAGVLTIRMNRPEKKNALTQDMYGRMADAVEAAQTDPAIKVVVLTGAADAFTAGNDLSDFAGANNDTRKDNELPPVARYLQAILQAEKPLMAAVNGLAVGVGVTMLLHCDLVYASPNATFQTPFVNLGLVPEAGSSLLLPQLVGSQKANELFLLGDRVSAADAEAMGLIAGTFEAEDLLAEVGKRAASLAAKAPTAVRLTKGLVRKDREAIALRMADESVHFSAQLKTPEFAEAASAFAERRAPDFSKLENL